jgi:hypothetical protein
LEDVRFIDTPLWLIVCGECRFPGNGNVQFPEFYTLLSRRAFGKFIDARPGDDSSQELMMTAAMHDIDEHHRDQF